MTNLEQQILDNAGKELQYEIDFQILSNMLCEIGWTRVVLQPMTWEQGAEIDGWVETNVKGHHETMGLVWVFEEVKDANWFSLRWLSK